MKKRLQRGQALILIALAFVGLAGFIGLAVDGGILYTNVGHLRKAVDAASLAAANQFREGLTVAQLEASAKEFLDLNNLESATANVYICEESINPLGPPYGGYHDPTLCRCEDETKTFGDVDCDEQGELDHRKLVKVEGELPVEFAFLPIIGLDSIDIRAEAVSETAALDLILVLDTSPSMAYDLCSDGDDNDGDGTVDDCLINGNRVGSESDSDVPTCVAAGDCQPYEDVRDAAQFLIDRMYFPFDRMGIVTFSQFGLLEIDLQNGDDWAAVTGALNATDVSEPPDPATWCPDVFTTGDPTGCTPTNMAAGIRNANQELASNGREEAVWIIILLSDGAANAAQDDALPPQWICPGSAGSPKPNPNWIQPYCVDTDPASRHNSADSMYDPDDRARDMADLAGCLPSPNQAAACPGGGGNGVVIFTIGLGDYVTNNQDCDTDVYSAAECTDAEDLGEQLLRYIASVGDDGDPDTDPCSSEGIGSDCGNYYYSPTGGGVLRVFEAIAGRIFTRITH